MQLLARIIEGIKFATNMTYSAAPLFDTCIKLNAHIANGQYPQAIEDIDTFNRFAVENDLDTEKIFIQFDTKTPKYNVIKDKLSALLPALISDNGTIHIDVVRINAYREHLQQALQYAATLTDRYAATTITARHNTAVNLVEKYPADDTLSLKFPEQIFTENAPLRKRFESFLKERSADHQVYFKKSVRFGYELNITSSVSLVSLNAIKSLLCEMFEAHADIVKNIETMEKATQTIKNDPQLLVAGLTENEEALISLLQGQCIAAKDVAPFFEKGLAISVSVGDSVQTLRSIEDVQVFNHDQATQLLSPNTLAAYIEKVLPVLESQAEHMDQIPQLRTAGTEAINRIIAAAVVDTPAPKVVKPAVTKKSEAPSTHNTANELPETPLLVAVFSAPTADTLRRLVLELHNTFYITPAKNTYIQGLKYAIYALLQQNIVHSQNEILNIIQGIDSVTSAYLSKEIEAFLQTTKSEAKNMIIKQAKSEYLKAVAHFPDISSKTLKAIRAAADNTPLQEKKKTPLLAILIPVIAALSIGTVAYFAYFSKGTPWVEVPADIQTNTGSSNGQEPYKVWDSLGSEF